MPEVRLIITALLLFWAVIVDFTSRVLSMGSDALLIGLAVFIAWPVIKTARSKPRNGRS